MLKLPDLPFDAAALEPHISRTTMETHHGKHHAGYVKKTNAALKERASPPETLEDIVRLAARDQDAKLFNNAAQAWNHGFFWQTLSPAAEDGPKGALRAALEKAFGSLDAFREEARARGENHFGSGWLWLVADESGAVLLSDTHDAHSPVTEPAVTPLIVCDLWEHAYYLDYKNERGKFLDAFLSKLINWRFAEAQYEAALRKGRGAWTFPV